MTSKSFGPLVRADWLREQLQTANDPSLIVFDFRWYLSGKVGIEQYAKGHIPGARFVALESVTASSGPGRHPIATQAQFELAMRTVGLNVGQRVVVYDDVSGSIAARLWWLLRYFGHERVAVLDGGLQAYTRTGATLSTEPPAVTDGTFVAQAPRDGWVVDQSYVLAVSSRLATQRASGATDANAHERNTVLLDARVPERYRGDLEPVDARPGHIPSAKNAPWVNNIQPGPELTFKSSAELKVQYEALGVTPSLATDVAETIVYCGSGVTACHDVLAMNIAGLPQPKLYEGSWSDWARNDSLTAVTGE